MIHIYIYIYTHTYAYMYTYIYIYICMLQLSHVCMYVCIYICHYLIILYDTYSGVRHLPRRRSAASIITIIISNY